MTVYTRWHWWSFGLMIATSALLGGLASWFLYPVLGLVTAIVVLPIGMVVPYLWPFPAFSTVIDRDCDSTFR